MSYTNDIQSKIQQLNGGTFESLFNEYLYKKYEFTNIQTLGVQTGTDKPTKGTPDSYVYTKDKKYILINYGSVKNRPANKIKADILSCFNTAKLSLEKVKIKKIICGHCSTNIHIEQFNDIMQMLDGIEIELIGIDTLSHDLAWIYPHIAKNYLGVEIDTNQFFEIEDFVKAYDANGMKAPIDCDFLHRKKEIETTCTSILKNAVTVLTGQSGIGKTRLAIEACRAFDSKGYKVYCILNNGNLLYEDIKYYIDTPGNYLLLLDDANLVASLDNVLQTLLSFSSEYEIKVLITVRDYARDRVISTASKYTTPNVIKIGRFTDEEIKDILKTDLEILNPDYLNKILEIANGNARLAYMAGNRAVDGGYQAIRNAEDIFRNYYGRILNEAELTKDDILMLFLIAVAGPVRKGKNQLYLKLKKQYGAEISEDEIIEKLYSLELVDWYKNEITKISDQSFGNYILYYVLFEKKWVSIESLLSIGFPQYRYKTVYALNTISDIFNAEGVAQYVENGIISAWNNAPDFHNMEYLEAFYRVDPDKALSIIKKKIKQEKHVDFDIHSFDVKSHINNYNISTKEIEILGGLKNTASFEDSIELLMLYFEKRPDLIMDFYFVICGHLLYDQYSWNCKYEKERILIDRLWQATNEGENYNFSILYIHVAQYALKTELYFTEQGRNRFAIKTVRMMIGFNKEIAILRNKIWKTLGILRTKNEYRGLINDILSEVGYNGLTEKNAIAYIQSDFDTIFAEVIKKDDIDFFDAKIIDEYREVADQLNSPIDDRYLISENNHDFKMYKILSGRNLPGWTTENKKLQKNTLVAEFGSYSLEDYRELFETCNFLQETVEERYLWSLSNGLEIVFELLETTPGFYGDVLEEYFNKNAPFILNGHRQVDFLLSTKGYEKTYSMMNGAEYRRKDTWLSLIWECINESDITDIVVRDYSRFLESNLDKGNPIVPSAALLAKYGEKDNGFRDTVIQNIEKKPGLSAAFLEPIYQDDDIIIITTLFKDNYDTLSHIYMNAVEYSNNVDYDGKLFYTVFDKRPNIWKEYVDLVKKHLRHVEYEQNIFNLIWSTENWQECIEYAYSVLIDDMGFFIEYPAQLLFGRAEQESEVVQNRKKQWLLDSLHENCMDVSKCRDLIDVVVNVMPYWKQDFILEYLENNKKIDDFKSINLFPMSVSWSGSEVPLIIEKILFLQSLNEKLKGVDYIEHRNYINKTRRDLEAYKERVEISEYLEKADYA